jgi:UDP-galactopyranose mutase
LFDYIIVGAGFAGSVIAERIATQLNKKVLIIEKRNHIGGNCYDFITKEGIIIHKYGPHLFHTNYKKVWDYLSQFTEWRIYHHRVLAFIDGKKIPIPFNLNSLYEVFPPQFAKKLENKLLQKFSYGGKIPILELRKVNDKDLRFLADFIYQKVFLNYTKKQWGLLPEELNPEVTARVPVFISRDNRYFQDKYQGVPAEGYAKLFERMLNHPNIKILLNTNATELIKLDLESKKIYFLGKKFKGKLIYTGAIDELFNYKFGYLKYRSLHLKFRKLDQEYFQEVATVNFPNDYDFTRITEFKHIHPSESRSTILLEEYPKEYKPIQDVPYYPFFTKQSEEAYAKYREIADSLKNLILVGRLAEYRYYDMDDIVKRALEVFEEL